MPAAFCLSSNSFGSKLYLLCEKDFVDFAVDIDRFFSEENYDQFCLAYMFTYRDFEGGTLGLAWTGDLKNAGGVCEKNGVSEEICTLHLIRGT